MADDGGPSILTDLSQAIGWTGEVPTTATLDFLSAILKSYTSLQRAHADTVLRAARFEQDSRRLEESHAEATATADQSSQDASTAIKERDQAVRDLSVARVELAKYQAGLDEARGTLHRHKAKWERIEEDRNELQRQLDRRNAERASLEAEQERLLKLVGQLRQHISSVEEHLLSAQSKMAKLQFDLSRATGEASQFKERAEWASSELDRVLGEIAEYRRQKSREIVELNGLLTEKTVHLDSAQITLQSLRQELSDKSSRLSTALEEVRDLKEQMTRNRAEFEAEMGAKSRLAVVYKSASESAADRIKELEDLLQAHVDRVSELESRVSSSPANGRNSTSIADVFAENSALRVELTKAQSEAEKLRECLQEVCGEIEARAPLLAQERRENDRLKRELLALTQQVVNLTRAREDAVSRASSAVDEVDKLKISLQSLTRENADLSRQLQALVYRLDHSDQESPGGSAFADAIETDEEAAVVFRSVGELQQRNAELLRRVHQLEAELELIPRKHAEQLESAMQEIAELNEARNRQSAMLESIMQTSRSTVPSGRQMSLESNQRSVESTHPAEVDQLRQEKMRIEAEFSKQLQQVRTECSELRVKLGRAESQSEFASESLKMVKQTLETERSELNALRSRCVELSEFTVKLQNQVQSVSLDALSAREREHKVTIGSNRLTSEFQALKASEERLSNDLSEARSERDRLSRLIATLQATLTDGEAAFGQIRERLSQQMAFLEKDLLTAKERLAEEQTEHQRIVAQFEKEHSEHILCIESMKRQQIQQSQLIQQQPQPQHQNDQVDFYKASAKASEKALEDLGRAFEEYRQQVESSGAAQLSESASEATSLRGRLTEADIERQRAVERMRLLEVTETELHSQIAARNTDVQRLTEMLNETQWALQSERESNAKLMGELESAQAEIVRLNEQLAGLSRQLEIAKQAESGSIDRQTTLQQDLIDLQQRHDELRSQYEELLDRLETSLKAPSFSFTDTLTEGSNAETQQVIRFLRWEKDALERQKTQLEADNKRLQASFDQLTVAHTVLRTKLLDNSESVQNTRLQTELSEMRKRMEQMNGFRESAATLSAHLESATARLSVCESELQSARVQLQPLKEENRELRATVAAHQMEVKGLTDDRDLWKRRYEAASGGSQPMMDDDTQKAELEAAKRAILEEANQRYSNLDGRYKKLMEKMKESRERIDELTRRNAELESTVQNQQQQPSEDHPNELEETRELLNDALRQLEEAKAVIQDRTAKVQQLTSLGQKYKSKLGQSRAEHEQSLVGLRQEIADLQSNISDVQREAELYRTALSSQWKSKFDRLSAQLEEYRKQFGDIELVSPMVTQQLARSQPSDSATSEEEQMVDGHDDEEEDQHEEGHEEDLEDNEDDHASEHLSTEESDYLDDYMMQEEPETTNRSLQPAKIMESIVQETIETEKPAPRCTVNYLLTN